MLEFFADGLLLDVFQHGRGTIGAHIGARALTIVGQAGEIRTILLPDGAIQQRQLTGRVVDQRA